MMVREMFSRTLFPLLLRMLAPEAESAGLDEIDLR